MSTIEYAAEVRHDGRLHKFIIPTLELPICRACGEKFFTAEVDRQVNDELRSYLGLLNPLQIRQAIKRIGMSQEEVAKRLAITEESLSLWLDEVQIQSRSMDTLLRTYFAFPAVRAALSDESAIAKLGLSDATNL